jgi:negative regulator of flagellin synthesis FlgM
MAIEPISSKPISLSTATKTVAKEKLDDTQTTNKTGSTDTINVDNTTSDIKSAIAAGASTPVVNEDRVAAIKAAINSGTYQINPDSIAKKMLQFEDKLPNSS